ncbi:uncharacterized protein LOC127809399 [Diospyros lotus]|uniref:uncharacterized protein LOC127809399 n=1 Tax=Diospyros lotus TaxID=55363 RepID=UPI00224D5440|nr:uncharacterized protein LOC127809399 [Diospyros lotus]
MARVPTNRERLENLENMSNTMEDRFSRMEQNLQRLTLLVEQQQSSRRSNSRSLPRQRTPASVSQRHDSRSGDESEDEQQEDNREATTNPFARKQSTFKPRLQFPTFNSEDPISWLSRANQFFKSQDITSQEKVDYAAYFLEGEANHWWQWLSRTYESQGKTIRWKDFEQEIRTRFGPTGYMDYDEALSKMQQTGSLRDYQKEFEKVATQVRDWPEKALIGAFVGGLKPELATEVKLHRPTHLRHAIEIARLKDEQVQSMRKSYAYKGPTMATSSSGYKPKVPPPPQAMSNKSIPPGVRRLSWDEMQKRREQGLCFNCNKKFTPGHKCKKAQAFLIECDHPQDWDEEEAEPDMPLNWPAEAIEAASDEQPEVSLHALAGSSGPQTMRVTAMLRNREVSLLIDNGSTHNFISTRIAQRLQIPITHIDSFHVRVASGEKLTCTQQCKGVNLKIQHIAVTVDLYAIPLAGVDIVLGVQWLSQLGKVAFDYKRLTMEFTLGDQQVCLSMQPGHSHVVKRNEIQKLIRAGGECYAIQVATQPRSQEDFPTATDPQREEIATDIQEVLADFPLVLQEPTTLPPSRACDHRITLIDEQQPVNVPPYRYAHHQKDEIERQVKEMLK